MKINKKLKIKKNKVKKQHTNRLKIGVINHNFSHSHRR